MSCMLVIETLLTKPSTVENASFSSQRAGYPVSNAYDIDRRKRFWRTAGYFPVVGGENTIVINEGSGDITAALLPSEYSSDSDFLAAVAGALTGSAGALTYSAARDPVTHRIKISANGSFALKLSASPELAALMGFDPIDRASATSHEADVIRIHASEWLKWDFGFPANPSAFVAVADRNRPLKLSPTAVVKLQANWTDDWSAPAFEQVLSPRDMLIAAWNKDGLAPNVYGYRYWRLLLEDPDNAIGYIEFGALGLGTHMKVTRGAPVFPLDVSNEDLSYVSYSEGGQTIAGRKAQTRSYGVSWQGLNVQSKENVARVWQRYGLHSSFFVVIDAEGAFTGDAVESVSLVKFAGKPDEKLVSPANWAVNWTLREEL